MYFLLALTSNGIASLITATATAWVTAYGYGAIFILMLLESATFPVPSEVVLPLAGLLAHQGALNFYIALAVAMLAGFIGTMIDYAIGYYLGKAVVYKHLQFFHVKKQTLDNFDAWFAKNGIAAVFLTRFIPVLRTVINFPAGFARMNLKTFLFYTLLGELIWDAVLMAFGFYVLSVKNLSLIFGGVAMLAIILYVVYRFASSKMRK